MPHSKQPPCPTPILWRVARTFSVCLVAAGIAFASAGWLAGLPTTGAAGGEILGGGVMFLGGSVLLLLSTTYYAQRTRQRGFWISSGIASMLVGFTALIHGANIIHQDSLQRERTRHRLQEIGDAIERYKAENPP